MTSILRHLFALLLIRQLVPFQNKAEFDQSRIATERHHQRMDLSQTVIGFKSCGTDISQLKRLLLANDADPFLLGEMLVRI